MLLRVEGVVYNLVTNWSELYFHFWAETVPRLLLGESLWRDNDKMWIYMYVGFGYVQHALEVIGLGERVLPFSHHQVVLPSDGVYFARPSTVYYITAEGAAAIYRAFAEETGLSRAAARGSRNDPIVYIRRTVTRPAVNDAEVLELLQSKYGSQLVVFDDSEPLTLEDTISLFSRAGMVFGTSGAGMVNLVFTPPSQKVALVENIAAGDMCLCHYHTATAVGGRHYFLFDATSTEKYAPQTVDVDELGVLLDLAWSERLERLATEL